MKLEDWRKEIDSIDAEIAGLISRRAELARRIGRLKAAAGLPVVDEKREAEILQKAAAHDQGVLKRAALVRIFRSIIRESRNIQMEMQSKAGVGERV